MTTPAASLRQSREATVLEHMTAENAKEFERCIGAFGHPRYEIVATGEVWDGHDGVNALLIQNITAFPDFKFEPGPLQHSADAVIVEGRVKGTHLGKTCSSLARRDWTVARVQGAIRAICQRRT